MSASNWAACPQCAKRREKSIALQESEIQASYGHIPVEEFDRRRAELEKFKADQLEETFREDYEIYGAEDGEVKVSYGGSCGICGLRLKFEHVHPLEIDA